MTGQKPTMIIAVDFDGTCVTHEFPEVGQEIGAASVLKRLTDEGHRLILWTMRSDQPLTDATQWFCNNGIPLFGINNNSEQRSWTSSPKAYAQIYIDDAALGCPLIFPCGERPHVDWKAVEQYFWPKAPVEPENPQWELGTVP